MSIVVGFSNDNAEKSSSLSLRISKIFTNDDKVLSILEPIIRKIAHLSEYAVGGVLFYGFFLTYNMNSRKQVLLAGMIGVVYAITDEIHQLFIPRKNSEK